MSHWTIDDYTANLCEFAQVGQPRQAIADAAPVAVPELPPELASIPAAILKRDAMVAYQRLGGSRYLMENEALLTKILVRLLPAEVQQETKSEVVVTINWIGPDRLAYLRGGKPAPAEVIDNAPALPVIDNVPWKEPAPVAVAAAEARALLAPTPR